MGGKNRQTVLFLLSALLLGLASSSLFTQTQRLVEGTIGEDVYQFGESMAISADASMIAIGAPRSSKLAGLTATWIRNQTTGTYARMPLNLYGNPHAYGYSGQGLAFSLNGSYLAVGEPGHGDGVGRVIVYQLVDGYYIQLALFSAPPEDQLGASEFGATVAFCADSSRLVVGAPGDDANTGAIWIFSRVDSTFTSLGKLVGANSLGRARQGHSLAVTSDCSTLAVGGPSHDGETGAVWVFGAAESNPPASWSQQAGPLEGSHASKLPRTGWSVSLSANGNRLAVGSPGHNVTGASWIFDRIALEEGGYVWSEAVQVYSTATTFRAARQGSSVVLSADGETLFLGAESDGPDVGRIHAFTHVLHTDKWVFSAFKQPTGPGSSPHFGSRMVTSADQSVFVVGAPSEAFSIGAAYVLSWS